MAVAHAVDQRSKPHMLRFHGNGGQVHPAFHAPRRMITDKKGIEAQVISQLTRRQQMARWIGWGINRENLQPETDAVLIRPDPGRGMPLFRHDSFPYSV